MMRLALIAAAALAATGSAGAQTRNADTVLMSPNPRARAGQEQLGYADAVVAGDMIYLSGIVAGRGPDEASLEPAFERVFRQAAQILERAGASLADVVEMTSYHTDVTGQIQALSTVQKRLLGSPPPAWTAIQVVRLLPDDGIAEIKLVARRPRGAATR